MWHDILWHQGAKTGSADSMTWNIDIQCITTLDSVAKLQISRWIKSSTQGEWQGQRCILAVGLLGNSAKSWFLVHSDVLLCTIKHVSEAGTEHEKSVVSGTLEPNFLRVFTTFHLDGFQLHCAEIHASSYTPFLDSGTKLDAKGKSVSRFAPESGGSLSRIGTLHVCGEH